MVDANILANPESRCGSGNTGRPGSLPPAAERVDQLVRLTRSEVPIPNLEAAMSDVLGARVGSDDPEQIAEVRNAAPKILAIGAQPTATPKQAPRAGAVYDERGYLEGRDPRTMSPDELRAMGHMPMSPIEAIRAHCLDCCGGSAPEVGKCLALRCPSWPFRMGKSPWHKPPSNEQREAMRERGRRLAKAKKSRRSDTEDEGAGTSFALSGSNLSKTGRKLVGDGKLDR
jgi:hypothetical protein